MKIDLKALEQTFEKGHMFPDILLGTAKLLDSTSRETAAFNDPRYFPFYYHLGKFIEEPITVCQIGAKLGLIGACLMQGCDHSIDWHALEEVTESGFVPLNMIKSNLRKFSDLSVDVHLINDISKFVEFVQVPLFELGLLTDKYDDQKTQAFLDFLWCRLQPEGLLVVDYINDKGTRQVFDKFCRVKNREPVIFNTRYGVGMVNR